MTNDKLFPELDVIEIIEIDYSLVNLKKIEDNKIPHKIKKYVGFSYKNKKYIEITYSLVNLKKLEENGILYKIRDKD